MINSQQILFYSHLRIQMEVVLYRHQVWMEKKI